MKNTLLSILCLVFLITSLNSQNLVTLEYLKDVTAQEVIDANGIPAEYDMEFYRVEYTTKDLNEVQDTASGLLIVPKDQDFAYPMLTYQHGTLPDRNTGMSNLTANDVDLATIYGSFGFIVVAPDYLGVLSSRGFHPYVHADSESSAALDMMRAVKNEALGELGIFFNERTFITGYSQGGHAAMALHRDIQTDHADEFDVVAGFPMSGPYSISEKMIDFTLGDQEYFFVAYLPNVALSYKAAYPQLLADVELEDIFKPEYIADINRFKNEEIDLIELNNRLIDLLVENEGMSVPARMIHDSTLTNIKTNPSHPLSMALADNDVYDWVPESFMVMYYCTGDDQVTFENAILAESEMLSKGALFTSAVDQGDEDHGGCVIPAVSTALEFIFIMRGISSNTELLDNTQFSISPNPAHSYIQLSLDNELDMDNAQLRFIDISGKIVKTEKLQSHSTKVDLTGLNSGLHLVEIETKNGIGIKRIIVNK